MRTPCEFLRVYRHNLSGEPAVAQEAAAPQPIALTLKRAIELALQNSKDIQVAKIQSQHRRPRRADQQGAVSAQCLCGFRSRLHLRNSRDTGRPRAGAFQLYVHRAGV